MQPTKLVLNNFLSYGDAEIDFGGITLAALLGHNGAGKSSLATDAITWALYGEGRYKDIDRYIRQGQEQAVNELQFVLAGENYRVIRTRSNKGKGKSTLELAKFNCTDWEPMSGTTIKETQEKIRELLRMDYETFVSSCVILQDESDRLTKATPGKRMEIFGQILGLDVYDRLQEAAKAKARGYRESAAGARGKIENLATELSRRADLRLQEGSLKEQLQEVTQRIRDLEIDLEAQEKTVSDLKVQASRGSDLRARQEQISRESAEIANQLQVLDQKRQRLQQIIDRGDEIREKAAELGLVKAQMNECEDKASRYMQLSRDAQALNDQTYKFDKSQESEIARIEATVNSKRAQAELLVQVPCAGAEKDNCKLLASARDAAADVSVLEKRLLELKDQKNPHVDAWQKVCAARDAIGYDQAAHQAHRDQIPALEKWARVLPELQQAEDSVAEARLQAGLLQDRRQGFQDELIVVEADLAAMDQIAADLRKAEAVLSDTKYKINGAREEEQDAKVKLGTVQNALKDLEKKAEEKTTLETELKVLAQEEHYYTQLAKAFGKAGIPTLIIENSLPEVETLANDLLSRLTGGRMDVRFETQKEAKSTGNISDTLDIIVADELGERPYEGWSGAERFEVNLSIRLAISKFLAKRAGAKIEVLVIDEGASCLDAAGREKFVESINIIAEDFKLVIVVTHIDELKEAFPQQLIVSKTPEGSRVEVVA